MTPPGARTLLGAMLLLAAVLALGLAGSAIPAPDWLAPDPWLQTDKITPDDAHEPGPRGDPSHAFARFGRYMDEHENRIAVMAPNMDTVYIFESTEAGWEQTSKIDHLDRIGSTSSITNSLALYGDLLAIGAPNTDTGNGHGSPDPGTPQHGAAYLLQETDEGEWEEIAYFEERPEPYSYFGEAVDLEDDVLVIGAPSLDSTVESSGSVFIYERQDDGWLLEKEFQGDQIRMVLGASVAIQDGTIVAGAQKGDMREDGGGIVETYEKIDDEWTKVDTLTAPDPIMTFSYSLDTDGDTLIVGAAGGDYVDGIKVETGSSESTGIGEAFIYERDGEGWNLTARLFNPIPAPRYSTLMMGGELFGSDVGIRNGTAVVGAMSAEPSYSGAAYVYERSTENQEWDLKARLVPNGTFPHIKFGFSTIAMDEAVLVGAPGDNQRRDGTPYPASSVGVLAPVVENDGRSAGAVYEFSPEGFAQWE